MKKLLLFIALLPTLVYAQLELPYSIKMVNPKPIDYFYLEADGTPYDSFAEAIAALPAALRYRGMTVNINGVEYWFNGGTTDGNLVVKVGEGYFWKASGTTTVSSPLINATGNLQITPLVDGASVGFQSEDTGTNIGVGRIGTESYTIMNATKFGVPDEEIRLTFDMFNSTGYGAGAIFGDSRATPKGLEYAADYSATFTDRSLIDKGFANNNYIKLTGTSTVVPEFSVFKILNSTNNTNTTFEHYNSSIPTTPKSTINQFVDSDFMWAEALMRVHPVGNANEHYSVEAWTSDGIGESRMFYQNNLFQERSFKIQSDKAVFTDGINSKGIEYAADYSLGFNDRSLIDKGFANNNYWPLGGTKSLTSSVTINGTGTSVIQLNSGTTGTWGRLNLSNSVAQLRRNQAGGGTSQLALAGTTTLLSFDNDAGLRQTMTMSGSGWTIDDDINSRGLEYTLDYSSNYTDRSLIDKGYAVSAFAPISGGTNYWKTTGVSTITGTAEIDTGTEGQIAITYEDNFDSGGLFAVGSGAIELRSNDFGLPASFVSLVMQNGNALISDNSSSKEGLTYAANYSATFTDRSLVDKGYVDAAITLGGGIGGSTTQYQIPYGTAANTVGSESEFIYDYDGTAVGTPNTLYISDAISDVSISPTLLQFSPVDGSGATNYQASQISRGSTSIGLDGTNINLTTSGPSMVNITSPLTIVDGQVQILENLVVGETTLGSQVLAVTSTATNDDPIYKVYQNRVATTDATVTTLHTQVIPASTAVLIEATVVARRTGGTSGTAEDAAAYQVKGLYKNVGGTATIIGTVSTPFTAESQSTWNATLTPSAGNVLVQVTGAANNNITWHLIELKVSQLSN